MDVGFDPPLRRVGQRDRFQNQVVAREQLFEAAERILLREGPHTLTSRAITDEAGCAKGVLHRHFDDFDAFLVELVLDRRRELEALGRRWRSLVGSGSVVSTLAGALAELFDPVVVGVVALVISRDELRRRLRDACAGAAGVPLMREATAMIEDYLAAEQHLGRLGPGADVVALAPMLVGAGHLLFADRDGTGPDQERLRAAVRAVVATDLAR